MATMRRYPEHPFVKARVEIEFSKDELNTLIGGLGLVMAEMSGETKRETSHLRDLLIAAEALS